MFSSCQAMKNLKSGNHVAEENITFAGNFTSLVSAYLESYISHDNKIGEWIVDTKISNHMFPYAHLLIEKHNLQTPVTITLLDGSTKLDSVVGNVVVNSHMTLTNVLLVREFKHNLLSVSSLL